MWVWELFIFGDLYVHIAYQKIRFLVTFMLNVLQKVKIQIICKKKKLIETNDKKQNFMK